ncbi:DsrE family protein [Archaeoglobus neptunius]|uniref:DsrE family protein n=1 Tax=Archaeoglobus neptunius TaxID=2798580 RepID=UPI0019295C3E|nr:DsrE family protein [Archaeoglobus neptunius]
MKFVIVALSGELEKLQAVAALASGAAVMGMQVRIFVAMDALASFRKSVAESRGWKVAGDAGKALLKTDKTFIDYLKDAREVGDVKLYICQDSMNLLQATTDDFADVFDEVTTVTGFFEIAEGAAPLVI